MFTHHSARRLTLLLALATFVFFVYQIRTETLWLHFVFPPECPARSDAWQTEAEKYKDYGVTVEVKFGNGMSAERNFHDEGQLLTPSELVRGHAYYEVGEDYRYKIIADSNAYRNLRGEWLYDYHHEGYPDEVRTKFLSDKGVVPYDNGCWNKYNYLVPVDETE